MNESLHPSSALALLFIVFSSLIILRGKVPRRTLLDLFLAGTGCSVYIITQNSSHYHIYCDMTYLHRISILSILISVTAIFDCFYKLKLVPKFLYKIYLSLFILVFLFLVILGRNPDEIQLGAFLMFPITFCIAFLLPFKHLKYRYKCVFSRQLELLSLLVFFLSSLNEMYRSIVAGEHYQILGLGFSAAVILFILAVNEEINNTYSEKQKLLEDFVKNQQKVFELEKKKSAYDAVAMTSKMVAHDLRKPMSFLQGFLGLLSNSKTQKQMYELLGRFKPDVEMAFKISSTIIDDILTIGKKEEYDISSNSVTKLLKDTLAIMSFEINRQIEITFEMKHRYQVLADGPKLVRVFQNIIGNALNVLDYQGWIKISTRDFLVDSKSFVEITVQNNGPLISSAERETIFDPFVSNRNHGTGLGLTICKQIVEKFAGSIECISNPEELTKFIIKIPSDGSEDHLCSTKIEIKPSNGKQHISIQHYDLVQSLKKFKTKFDKKLTVLFVDDEEIYTSLVEGYLKSTKEVADQINFQVEKETQELIELDVNKYDLVILDIDLKAKINGFDLLKIWRDRGFRGKVCIHSSQGGFEISKKTLEENAEMYLPKPISRDLLFEILKMTALA